MYGAIGLCVHGRVVEEMVSPRHSIALHSKSGRETSAER